MTTPETAAPAPAGSSGIPVVSDAIRVIKAMFSPGSTFGEMNPVKPPFWGAWLFTSLVFTAAQYLMMPFIYKAQTAAMATSGRPLPGMNVFLISTLVSTPVICLVMVLITSLVLWVTINLTGGEGRYRQVMSINIFSWGPILIQQFVTWGILKSRGLGAVQTAADLRPAIGLDLVLPAESTGFLPALLGSINPFSIWTLVITAVGLQVLLKMKSGSAWTAAIISFLVGAVIAALMTGLFT
jgi:hypothetical protein